MRRIHIVAAGLMLFGIAGLWLAWWSTPASVPTSVLFVGGTVLTMSDPPIASAMWIKGGRIRAVGSEAEVRSVADPNSHEVDLEGATLMPGLIEPHTHPLATAMLGSAIDVSGFTYDTPAQVREALEEGIQGFSPQPWIVAFGWDPVMMPDLEPPTLEELDALSPQKPLVVLTQMMHEAYANSAALAAAGITASTPDPPGAYFGRDENGQLNGVIHEVAALDRVVNAMPTVPPAVTELLLRWQYGRYAEAGYTTIGVLGPVGRAEDPVGMMRRLGNDPGIPIKTVVYALPDQLEGMAPPEDPNHASMILRGVKFWMDGSPYTGGAAFDEPYEDSALVRERLHLSADHMAPLNHEADAFNDLVRHFHEDGYQVAVHTQGERAVERALDAIEHAVEQTPREGHGHRLEHNALIRADQIERAKLLGVELGFFVDHIYYYGHQLPSLVGARVERYMPVGTAFNAGLEPTIHSDNPATPIGPFRAMRTAMLRTPRKAHASLGESESIDREQALAALTTNAARQLGVAGDRGSLDVGKAADFVVLDRNPLQTEPRDFAEIEVLGTWVGGQPVDTRRGSKPNLRLATRALGQLLSP
ncbi:MAG: amidohydrolase [Myxococcota bacterium]